MTTLYRRITRPGRARQSERRQGRASIAAASRCIFRARRFRYVRDPRGGWPPLYRHVGLYAYRRSALLVLASLEPTPLERAEALEQLRALEHGIRIKAVETAYDSIGVDTPEDLEQVRRLLAATSSN